MEVKEFLRSRPEEHVCHLQQFGLEADGKFRASFTTVCWWDTPAERNYTLSLDRVQEYLLVDPPDKDIVVLSCGFDSPLLLNYQPTSSIFGQAPLPDPPRFFHEFYELIQGTLGIKRDPITYLNWQDSFLGWRNMVLSRTYRMLNGPAQVVDGASELLERQVADHIVLPDHVDEDAPSVVVPEVALEFGNSWVLGSSLSVEL